MVRLTDRPDMTLDVYRGRKTTIQSPYFQRETVFVTSCLPTLSTKSSENGSPLKGKNLLQWEQILPFKCRPQFIWEAALKVTRVCSPESDPIHLKCCCCIVVLRPL